MTRKLALTALAFLMIQSISAQRKMTVEEYIKTYRNLAIEEMSRAKIPASITMAQAILESDTGGSPLAVEANNHFGIKCQVEWTGATFSHDDDAPGECFRKYANPEESFRDHSAFLTTRSRYAFLFDYPVTEYKSWATGLKTAGYATNPQYASALIRIIENNSLQLLDTQTPASAISNISQGPAVVSLTPGTNELIINLTDPSTPYMLERVNGILAVRAKEGDTFAVIAAALQKKAYLLASHNELPFNTLLKAGQVVYLKKKHKKAKGETTIHEVKTGDTMHEISQRYGIQIMSLYKLNLMAEDYQIKVGERIHLK